MTPKLRIVGVSKTFAGGATAIRALEPTSFDVDDGEFVALVGPSGCGKSTLLYVVAGLEDATAGEVLLDGRTVVGPGADRGIVCQSYNLFPWLSVIDNTRFAWGLGANRHWDESIAEVQARVDRVYSLLDLMGLRDFLQAYPNQLSGGMKQRVAIARALANDPAVLLMDEPFGALDAQTREEMQELMLLVCARWQRTILFVTHDVEEAIFLADRIIVMTPRPGQVRADLRVHLPKPRTIDLKLAPEFLALKREIVGYLHEGRRPANARKDILDRMFGQAEPP